MFFLFRLATVLGRTVAELVQGSPAHRPLDAWELSHWLAFDSIQPIGDARNEFHTALLASTIANISGKVLPASTKMSPTDFMPLSIPKKHGDHAALVERFRKMGATVRTLK